MNMWKKVNLVPFDEQDTTPFNLDEIHRVSEELIETGKIPIPKRKEPRKLKDATIARTNAYIRTTEDATLWITTPETVDEARVVRIYESKEPGWMIVRCFTVKQEFLLEVTTNYPIVLRLSWP